MIKSTTSTSVITPTPDTFRVEVMVSGPTADMVTGTFGLNKSAEAAVVPV